MMPDKLITIALKRPARVPPTMAVFRFSFLQRPAMGEAVASMGVPVETAVATTSVGSLDETGVDGAGVSVT